MADGTHIEWTDATWNPITGCSVVSPGCTNCYAMRLAGTRLAHHESRAGLTRNTRAGPVWTGEVRFNEQWLTQPLTWRKPRMVFVCAHGDLFAENVPDEWIDRVFAVMALSPQHTFQVLTKRAARMREYLDDLDIQQRICCAAEVIDYRAVMDSRRFTIWSADDDRGCEGVPTKWPLPNVWLGVSAEDQKRADERIPDLLATPAAVRWISAEPLLGPLQIDHMDIDGEHECFPLGVPDARRGELDEYGDPISETRLDWVVVGGESGPGARVWSGFGDAARSLRDQCQLAGVPFFMKQMQGERKAAMPPIPDDLMVREFPHAR